ncbi:hypothetical protein SAY86_015978 [Trapa natans]|uniref:BSD domain-containing protein n=1 Tax=Trapa natans TaxID=22666 RepID=A0AAN7QZ12_TRANT|nr:hypothetical protein SAY86_015978 [Trapa natans]
MAWLARSLANSLRLDDDDGAVANDGIAEVDGEEEAERRDNDPPHRSSTDSHGSVDGDRSGKDIAGKSGEDWQARGVKEDIDELRQTLTRQLWGVANFLVPPPSQPPTPSQSDPAVDEWDRFATPGGRSASSSDGREPADEAINEVRIREMDSRLEPIESDGEYGDGEEFEEIELIGVTDEVLAFASNIAMHPETWLDFPLDAEDDLDDFEMSDAQQEHALAIENLLPRLRALRIELCPCHMNESYFWKVYFVLLHSRLEKHDAGILSTPQVMEARAMWMQELKKKTKPEFDWPGRNMYYHSDYDEDDDMLKDEVYPGSPSYFNAQSIPFRSFSSGSERSSQQLHGEFQTPRAVISEALIVDKPASEENRCTRTNQKDLTKLLAEDCGDDDDDWPEEDSDLVGCSTAFMPLGIDDDISFSDLEDDLDISMPIRTKPVSDGKEKTIS